jgi:hypothetical protein
MEMRVPVIEVLHGAQGVHAVVGFCRDRSVAE